MRNHLLVLDGLRGVAALGVVFHHFGSHLPGLDVMPHAYLAVDFFFVLSGLVVAYAYEERLRQDMSFKTFLLVRAIRFAPLIVAGLAIGALLELGRPGVGSFFVHMQHVSLAALLGLFVIPLFTPLTLEPVLFPLNIVMWSLFLEIIVNIVYARFLRHLSNRAVIAIIVVSIAPLIMAAIVFKGLNCGFSPRDWWGGFPRVFFSFFLGVLFYRLRGTSTYPTFRFPAYGLAVILILMFAVPTLENVANVVFDVLAVVLVCPLLVIAGSNTPADGIATLCRIAGNLSYPLYMLHYKIAGAITFKLRTMNFGRATAGSLVLVGIAFICVFAYTVYLFYDKPVRSALSRRLLSMPTRDASGRETRAARDSKV